MKYLLDSDQIIWYLKGESEVVEKLQKLNRENLAVSAISVAEVAEGIFGEKKESTRLLALEMFLAEINVLDVTRRIAYEFARLRASLRKKGKLLDNFDLLIAGTCLALGLTLVTGNKRHFQRIPTLKLLSS